MVIPSRSSRNTIRMYLKNKPHKYGTKLFAVCCGETNYCLRIEAYCGARQDSNVVDTEGGKAAVIRNLKALWPSPIDRSQKRVVVTDREYSCVALSLRLLQMGFYSVGTVMPNRIGFPSAIKFPFKTVPKKLADQRGMCKLLRCGLFPDLFACAWLDNKPVYFLSCGLPTAKTMVRRKLKDGSHQQVSCPQFIADYNTYMNGVDAHDQLRLQRYSIQRSTTVQKYYKTLFFGLVDIALVNCYIVHRRYCQLRKETPMTHAQFRLALHEQLLELTEADFQGIGILPMRSPGVSSSPCVTPSMLTSHRASVSDDKQASSNRHKFRVCKVCSLLRVDSDLKVNTTRTYCENCSSEKARVYLCDRIRRSDDGNQLTCFRYGIPHGPTAPVSLKMSADVFECEASPPLRVTLHCRCHHLPASTLSTPPPPLTSHRR